MDKKHKQHLLVTFILPLLFTATLFFMYDDFVFQTYGEVVYYDYILKGENNQLKVENIEGIYVKVSFREGRIIFKDVNLTNGAVLQLNYHYMERINKNLTMNLFRRIS
ncbi:MAG: hypothetical protein ACLRQF_10815 [Thomasclavelia ramosa]